MSYIGVFARYDNNIKRKENIMKQDLLFIGIGFAGCKILSRTNNHIAKLFIDTDLKVIEKNAGLRIGAACCGKYSAGGDIELGQAAVKESKDEILKAIQDFNNIVVIAPLGGGTTLGATPKLIELLVKNNKNVQLITNLPFDIEGERKANLSKLPLKTIQKLCPAKVLANIDYKQLTNVTYDDVLNLQDEIYIKAIETLIN